MNVSEANAANTVLRALMNPRGRRTAEQQARLAQDAEFLAHKASGALGSGIRPSEVRRFFGTES